LKIKKMGGEARRPEDDVEMVLPLYVSDGGFDKDYIMMSGITVMDEGDKVGSCFSIQ
jgi:hypothetical protein